MALSADSNTYVLTYMLDEEPVGEEFQAQSYMNAFGFMYGEKNPTASHRRTYVFKILSTAEPLLPSTPDGDNESLRTILNKYYAGGEMRVYRNFGGDHTPFDAVTNPDGYTDMVSPEAADGSYTWADNVLTRFEVVLDGVDA